MFRIKICGITSIADALVACQAGADAIGLNLAPISPRCVSADLAREIADAVRGRVQIVGVFVNQPLQQVNELVDLIGLERVQFHGDETPQQCAAAGVAAIKALPFDQRGLGPLVEFADRSRGTPNPIEGLLIDARAGGRYGGTGRTVDWPALGSQRQRLEPTSWALAGGLRPDNVATAIRTAGPAGVDVASGVESSVGRKDRALVMAFVEAARQALA